jgi:hypothetical protein
MPQNQAPSYVFLPKVIALASVERILSLLLELSVLDRCHRIPLSSSVVYSSFKSPPLNIGHPSTYHNIFSKSSQLLLVSFYWPPMPMD